MKPPLSHLNIAALPCASPFYSPGGFWASASSPLLTRRGYVHLPQYSSTVLMKTRTNADLLRNAGGWDTASVEGPSENGTEADRIDGSVGDPSDNVLCVPWPSSWPMLCVTMGGKGQASSTSHKGYATIDTAPVWYSGRSSSVVCWGRYSKRCLMY
jgi:hypothetical protein